MLEQKPEHKHLDLPNFTDDDETDLHEKHLARQKRAKRRGWLIGIIVALLIIILVPTAFFALRGLRFQRVTYLTNAVTQGNLSLVVSATGPVQGTVYNADFVATGKITEIDVKVGQSVTSGQVLAKLDATALQDALNQAQASLQQQKDFGTQDAINIVQDQVNTAQDNLNNATLKAPHAGVVTAINGAVGGTPTSSIGSFIQIVDSSNLQIQANVNESDIGGIAVGQPAQFTVTAYSGRTFNGMVSAISPQGQSVSNVVTYPVTINVDMKGLQGANVLPGMTATVTITTQTRSNVLLIPQEAINFAQSSTLVTSSDRNAALAQAQQMLAGLQGGSIDVSKDNPTAAIVLEQTNGKWIVKPIVVGLADGVSYEVLAGLSEGEVITLGQNTTSPGTRLNPGSGGGGGGPNG